MSETISVFPEPRPQIRRVPVDRPWVWLAAGWRDIVAAPGPSLAYGLIPVVAGWLAILLMLWLDLPFLAGLQFFKGHFTGSQCLVQLQDRRIFSARFKQHLAVAPNRRPLLRERQ